MERVARRHPRASSRNDSPERFRGLGVDVIFGDGRFVGPRHVRGRRPALTAKTLRHRDRLAAGGAADPRPRQRCRYLTNETVFELRENVPHLIVVGSGPIGSELAQAFRRLGSEVTVVDIAPSDPAARGSRTSRRSCTASSPAKASATTSARRIASVEGTPGDVRVMMRQGRHAERRLTPRTCCSRPAASANVEGLGPRRCGRARRRTAASFSRTACVTSNPRIYVVGDVAGGHQFTHVAEHHAGIVLRHAIFQLKWAKPSTVVPWCTYTDPELARVGLSETEAKQTGVAHRVYRFPFDGHRPCARGRRDRRLGEARHRPRRARCSARRSSDRTRAS